jgi:DMSO reductase anchor subunit
MSREIFTFTVFSLVASLAMVAAWIQSPKDARGILAGLTTIIGTAAVFASAMIYIDTRRPFWTAGLVLPKFFGSALLLGSTSAAFVLQVIGTPAHEVFAPAVAALVIRSVLFLWSTITGRRARHQSGHPASGSEIISMRCLPWMRRIAIPLFVVSTAAGLAVMAWSSLTMSLIALVSTCASQVVERYSFFATCPTPRMPGGVPS